MRMKEPLGMGYTKRNRVYHISAILGSIILTMIVRILDGFQKSKLESCFVADSPVR